jgi:hypothetical protein
VGERDHRVDCGGGRVGEGSGGCERKEGWVCRRELLAAAFLAFSFSFPGICCYFLHATTTTMKAERREVDDA